MSLSNFPKDTKVVIYDKKSNNDIWYKGIIKYIPNSNTEKYFDVVLQIDAQPIINTRGHYINEVFQIPIVIRP